MAEKSRLILITGATRGLGRAMTEKFIDLGHTVVGCGRSENEVQKLTRAFKSPHHFSVVDVADARSVKHWADKVLASHGAPDLVLNNAALINQPAPLWEVPEKEFSDVIDVNIKGVVNVIREFTPAMIAQKSGVIVNFSSGWGRSTSPDVAPYCATKWAIEGLSQALAQELPRGMASIPLSPGVIHTDMLNTCFGASASSYQSPEKWAVKAVPYLLKLGPQHNGQSLAIG
jgi:NAD(P)-dependent dehydrogenase (short-subunit alcohol dehydrogenase family)